MYLHKDVGARSKGSCREIFKMLPFGSGFDKMDLTQQATSSGIWANLQIHILTQFTYFRWSTYFSFATKPQALIV